MQKAIGYIFSLLLTLQPVMAFADFDLVPLRRPSPTKTQEGFLAFPIFTHLPGVGSALGFGLLKSNILQTRMNILGAAAAGDSSLAAAGLTEVHAWKETVVFNFYAYSTRIPFQLYDRGTHSSRDYVSLLRKEYGATAEMNVLWWERRLQFSSMIAPSRLEAGSVASKDGDRFSNRDGKEKNTLGNTFRLQLDLTDDDIDPRKGMRLQVIEHGSLVYDGLHSNYASVSASASAFIPVGKASTWAFNLFRSSAFVLKENKKSEAELRAGMNMNCGSEPSVELQQKCQHLEDKRVAERILENKHGTSALLGGPTQLRGFPVGRLRGSESLFYATEFRWNITDEDTPFDFGFMSGRRSLLQIAPFIEWGTAVDRPDNIWKAALHPTYGLGFRLGFSGALLRADVGLAKEGPQFTFFFGYPWDLSIL